MTGTDLRYVAVIYVERPCLLCSARPDAGIHAKMDCGCGWHQEVGRYGSLNMAKFRAAQFAAMRGRKYDGATPTGSWLVETDDGPVAAG